MTISQPEPAPDQPARRRQLGAAGEFEEDEIPRQGAALPPGFNAEHYRERARAWLAGALTALLAVVVGTIVLGVVFGGYPTLEAVDLLGVLLSPLVALVGAATGFYYGGKIK